jgi:hypothetical protein
VDIVIIEETPAAVHEPEEVSAPSSVVHRDCTEDVPCATGDGHEVSAPSPRPFSPLGSDPGPGGVLMLMQSLCIFFLLVAALV